jgi:hypothetical protein
MVIGGNRGSGFSVQADLATTMSLPTLLENMAAEISSSIYKADEHEAK